MGLVIEGLFALAVILVALWLWSLRDSVVKDRAASEQRRREEEAARERAAREARLYRTGEALRCLGCGATFAGPLSDTGCPQCHLASFVVTERDYQREQRAALGAGRDRKEE